MHKLRIISIANVANVYSRIFTRLSTGGRPSAPLGSRILTSSDDIFQHNMWDHVQWTEEDKENAQRKAKENSSVKIPSKDQGKFDTGACHYWDRFYEMHQNKFFKDRKWLFLEFPELLASTAKCQSTQGDRNTGIPLTSGSSLDPDIRPYRHNSGMLPPQNADTPDHKSCEGPVLENKEPAGQTSPFPGQHASFRIFEVGCGAGNSVFPVVNSIKEKDAFLYCCDFSPRAIQLVKDHPDYDDRVCHAFVHDICEETSTFPFPPQSLDVILAVFVLSSISPQRIQGVVNRLSSYLKHGGKFLFRDYGRYDLSQLRFKKGRCLSDNFYTRGDGTCVYFFTKEEVHNLFFQAGLEEIQNLEDRRLKVNRGKQVVMHRVWMQSKYRKPHPPSCPPSF